MSAPIGYRTRVTRFDSTDRTFAICLAALAGYVDAMGYLATGGFFVSFMSGNTTRLGVGLGAEWSDAGIAARLIIMFVGGVAIGSLIGGWAASWRRPAVLGMIALLITGALLAAQSPTPGLAVALMATAMGMENVILADGEVRVGITYMTGTLVKIGQGIAAAIAGGPAWGWVPHLTLWSGLMSGAWIGAVMFFKYGLAGLWVAVVAALLLAFISLFQRDQPA